MNALSEVTAEAKADRPDWFKDAVIYQCHVKAFMDSNGDGMGDFRGLTERLDHIESLGATAVWLLPFYPSPMRDDGYDISEYEAINPAYGTMDDFRAFVEAAHGRGLKVITELVINHTSDQHEWFQRARQAPAGSPERNFYVWSDDAERWMDTTRIIFNDTETSNWTWDPVAGQFYWHRFFSHQPDLNFDEPAVMEAVLKAMHFWLDLGVDGLRLDAIPYLVERDGTSNENLPETHDVLKRIRADLDANYEGRMLLAEANQWPEDTRPYFGEGDECHMGFHFPLMPRMYMAVAQEDRHAITDIIRQTPEIPEECQWAIFLRNHDELTLEMVTDRERDYLWETYAVRQARADQHGHPPPPRAADAERPAQDRAPELDAAVDARHADPLLRRRDHDGRQHLSRRPRRGAHADAVVRRPQRGLQPRRSAAALPADDPGPGLRLRRRQRGGAGGLALVLPQLDAADGRRPGPA